MTHPGYPPRRDPRKDGQMLVLDLAPEITYRRRTPHGPSLAVVTAAVGRARWPGTVLPPVEVHGVVAYPVVRFSGARERLAAGVGPQMALDVLGAWEAGVSGGQSPAAPLRIVGFVSTAVRWAVAVEAARSVCGLGAGMVLRRSRPTALQLMDADATGVWVAGTTRASDLPEVWVQGRVGAARRATRAPAHRRMEEGLFAHALACAAIS